MIWFAWLLGCGGGECTPEACAELAPEGTAASDFERSLVEPVLASVRAGVRPWDAEGVGVCRGTRTCEAFLGADAGELAKGEYLVRASLRVPPVGDWTVTFESVCTPEGGEPVTWNRTYDVVATGTEHPFRIGALRRITSPAEGGAQSCTYTLTAPHPDGDKVYRGGWSTP